MAYINCLSRVQAHFHEDKERFLAGSERIRTYHEPDNRVTDHASGYQDTYTNVVLKGNMESVIEARAKVAR
jgi:protein subunit release factor A